MSLGFRQLFLETLKVYRKTFLKILKATLPLFVLALLARFLAIKVGGFSSVLLFVVSWGLASFAALKALSAYLSYMQHQNDDAPTSTSFISFVFFTVAGLHIQFASLLSGVFFIIPGLLIYSSAFLAQALITKHGFGPFEAIAESVDKTQGNVWRIVLLCVAFWFLLFIVEWVLAFATVSIQPESVILASAQGLLSMEIGLISYALMAVVYARLNPTHHSSGAPDGAP